MTITSDGMNVKCMFQQLVIPDKSIKKQRFLEVQQNLKINKYDTIFNTLNTISGVTRGQILDARPRPNHRGQDQHFVLEVGARSRGRGQKTAAGLWDILALRPQRLLSQQLY